MFERFNADARKAIVLAQDQTRVFNSDHVGTEHLLLSLVYEDTGVAAQSLESLGVTFQTVHTAIVETIGVGQHPIRGGIPFTAAAKTVLELSLRACGSTTTTTTSAPSTYSWALSPPPTTD